MFLKTFSPPILALCTAITATSRVSADEPLARFLPESANVVGVIHIKDVFASPRAHREKWIERRMEENPAAALAVPTSVETLLTASLVHPGANREDWSVAVFAIPPSTTFDEIARRVGGVVETLAGRPALESRRGAYLAELVPGVVGVMAPGYRQPMARWIESCAGRRQLSLSPYLAATTSLPASVVLAMDTRDMFSPARVRQQLTARRPPVEGASPERMAALVAGLQGIRCTAQIGETIDAEVSLTFSASPGELSAALATLFNQELKQRGLQIAELERAKVTVRHNELVLTATLSDASLRRVASLMVPPSEVEMAATPDRKKSGGDRAGAPTVDVAASKRYFKSIERIINDLQKAVDEQVTDPAGVAGWYDRFAKRIEQLPGRGVDAELSAYGERMSLRLRALAESLRGVAIVVDAQQRAVTYNVQYQPYSVGWGLLGGGVSPSAYNYTSNLAQVREQQAQAVGRGAQERQKVWTMILEDRAQLREKMRIKYGDSFVR